jgi:hypothetical protein
MMVTHANLDFETPAGFTTKGADDCSAPSFDSGSSGSKIYSGIDNAGLEPQRPSFAVSPCDQDDVNAGIKKHDTVVDPELGILGDDVTPGTVITPSYLKSADRARAYLNALQTKARSLNRLFGSGTTIDDSLATPMYTFVDGDCTLANGAWFLVVTGTLTMRGNTNFRGVILVMGKGQIIRNGGGSGDIFGGVTIAAFDRTSGGFTAPTFNTNGGGNSTIQYDSAALKNGLASATNVSGIREF